MGHTEECRSFWYVRLAPGRRYQPEQEKLHGRVDLVIDMNVKFSRIISGHWTEETVTNVTERIKLEES